MDLTRGHDEVVGETPIDARTFLRRYREDPDYQEHIKRVWGDRAYDTRPGVAIDEITDYGIRHGWGKQCTGDQTWTGDSRNNARSKRGVKCCSKFKNGQMAFDLPGPPNGPGGSGGNHDCGYGWSGRAQAIPGFQDDLKLTRSINPPAWMNDFLRLNAKQIQNTNINLESGQDFAAMSVQDQLSHLITIYQGVCQELIPQYYGTEHPVLLDGDSCVSCYNKLDEIYGRIDEHTIQERECLIIIKQIFKLYTMIHELANTLNTSETDSQNTIRRHLKKFSKGFLDLCNMIDELADLVGGKKSRRKSQKRKLQKRKSQKRTSYSKRKTHSKRKSH
jgi:hypothetical protein